MYNVQNLPEIVSGAFSRQTELRQEEHDAAVEVRRSIKPNVDILLKDGLSIDIQYSFSVSFSTCAKLIS